MTALYRAYRPQKFEDVIGQESVVRTLRNAIASDRVAHAYLFCGSKGTGKTTMAKLLAKAMNCEKGPTIDPCGDCESCVAIGDGRSIDVAEIDAASNNGVDAVREKIIDTVAFQPAAGTRRVYILDESHMLTTQAFNALLKTIEEPPAHVLFIFCTTETHKMMATVRDRCQRLVFAPPAGDQLVAVLRKTADAESINADDDALRAIARVAQGSFRNALGTLELLSTAFERTFNAADVNAHLGAFDEELLFDVVDAVVDGNVATVLEVVESLVQRGSDLAQFAGELAEHLRSVLVARYDNGSMTLQVGDVARLKDLSQRADEAQVLAAIDCLGDAVTRIRVGSDARISLEVALVRATQSLGLSSLALRLAKLEHSISGGYGAPIAQAPAPVAPAPVAKPAAPQPASVPSAKAAPTTVVAAPAAEPLDPPKDLGEFWARLSAAVSGDRPLFAAVGNSQPLDLTETALILETSTPIMFTDKLKKTLQAQTHQMIGRTVAVDVRQAVVQSAPQPVAVQAPAASAAPAVQELEEEIDYASLQDAPEVEEQSDRVPEVDPQQAQIDAQAEELLKATFDATELPTT